ncbi:MAG: hypothetical protein QM647_09215 [Asticcacaulis sp.]|uniref:hypothetical protein n=1 Tax=Asticcacaulis sp. TaxID=1872648 RepID=UPI0039E4E0C6
MGSNPTLSAIIKKAGPWVGFFNNGLESDAPEAIGRRSRFQQNARCIGLRDKGIQIFRRKQIAEGFGKGRRRQV